MHRIRGYMLTTTMVTWHVTPLFKKTLDPPNVCFTALSMNQLPPKIEEAPTKTYSKGCLAEF